MKPTTRDVPRASANEKASERLQRRVRGGDGRRPHVRIHGVTYTNDQLASTPSLIGLMVEVHVDRSDLRSVLLYSTNGLSLGVARAQGRWGDTPHSWAMRQQIRDLAERKELMLSPDEDPVLQLLDWQTSRRPTSPGDASPDAPAGPRASTTSSFRTPLTLSAERRRRRQRS